MKTATKEKSTVKESQKSKEVQSTRRVSSVVSSSPRKLSARSSFSVFLADFKAASSK